MSPPAVRNAIGVLAFGVYLAPFKAPVVSFSLTDGVEHLNAKYAPPSQTYCTQNPLMLAACWLSHRAVLGEHVIGTLTLGLPIITLPCVCQVF